MNSPIIEALRRGARRCATAAPVGARISARLHPERFAELVSDVSMNRRVTMDVPGEQVVLETAHGPIVVSADIGLGDDTIEMTYEQAGRDRSVTLRMEIDVTVSDLIAAETAPSSTTLSNKEYAIRQRLRRERRVDEDDQGR